MMNTVGSVMVYRRLGSVELNEAPPPGLYEAQSDLVRFPSPIDMAPDTFRA